MSNKAEDLVIIYEAEAEQWASYLRSLMLRSLPEEGVCCYDIATVSSWREDFLQLAQYRCKLLILSQGMLQDLCQIRRFFLTRVLRPPSSVVVLLCGVESLELLLEIVPLGEGCLQISSDEEDSVYVSTVTEVVWRGAQTAMDVCALVTRAAGLDLKNKRPTSIPPPTRVPMMVLPNRVPCENPGEVYILLRDSVNSKDVEVEFNSNMKGARVRPVIWNEHTLCVKAAELPAGAVSVTLYCGGTERATAMLQYHSTMAEVAMLLQRAADPVEFMLQAFQITTLEQLDQVLTTSFMKKVPAGGFQGLQLDVAQEREARSEDLPTLLHFAAQNGLLGLASVLLQCPGAGRTLSLANCHGDTPLKLAERHSHTQLQVLLKDALRASKGVTGKHGEDSDIYKEMGLAAKCQAQTSRGGEESSEKTAQEEQEEDLYMLVGANSDVYDSFVAPSKAQIIANRPPAPVPRPENTKLDSTPFISQVFKKKMSQGEMDILYSLPSKQARSNSTFSTYDTMEPSQLPGLQELIELQEQVKLGSLSMDEALERFSDWQRVQKGLDSIQQEKLRQLRANIINNRKDDENVYDKISIIHHTPDLSGCDGRRGSQAADAGFYSEPQGGQHVSLRQAEKP
ncbi:hypothetical protein GJAV_G00167660 [Gymnothorax javanicus]|nr:hypothetical protein GJAV_G00167660 [Gymnothorax javanicus]